eukprot:2162074-Ditylum_brightwellii.AAC.1
MTTLNLPMVAALVPTLPPAALACVGQYISPVKKSYWKDNVNTAYSNRQYIYSKVSMRSNGFGGRVVNKKQMLMRAAKAMDMKHGTMTMA